MDLDVRGMSFLGARVKKSFGSHEKATYYDDIAQGIWTVGRRIGKFNAEWREEGYWLEETV